MNQKGFSAVETIAILVVLIIVGAVGYIAHRPSIKNKAITTTASVSNHPVYPVNPRAPSSWKKYSNKQNNINISYPSNWNFSEDDSNGFDVTFNINSDVNTNDSAPTSFDISVYKGNLNQVVSQVEKNLINNPPQLYGVDTEELKVDKTMDYTFKGSNAILINTIGKGVPTTPGDGYVTYYQDLLIAANNSIYDFSLQSGSVIQGQNGANPINNSTIQTALGSLQL